MNRKMIIQTTSALLVSALAAFAADSMAPDLKAAADGTIFCFFGRGLESKHTWGGDRLTVARFNMAWLLEGEPKGEYQSPTVASDQIFVANEDNKSKQPRLDDQKKERP